MSGFLSTARAFLSEQGHHFASKLIVILVLSVFRCDFVNMLIIKGRDHLLVDCGTKCPQSLFEVGLPLTRIRNFLITHRHSDHIGGLEEAQHLGRYVTSQKPNMVINRTYEKIPQQSLRGGSEKSEAIAA